MVTAAAEIVAEAISEALREAPKALERMYPANDPRRKAYRQNEVAELVIRGIERRGFKVVPA